MRSVPEDVTSLVSDFETFLIHTLKGENLRKKAKDKRDTLIKRIKEVKYSYSQDFKEKRDAEESDEFDDADSNNDEGSLHSERTDKDEEPCYDGVQQLPPVAAQNLPAVFKSGYLEKRRKDHSFFGTEWQKRWCALSCRTFYYYGSEKDKQQKGGVNIDGYSVKMNNTLRKDSKKDWCFEISAPDKRLYQFCASSQKEAEQWVEQLDFVLRGMESWDIPLEEEKQMHDEVGFDTPVDEIYEELSVEEEEQLSNPTKPAVELRRPSPVVPAPVLNKSTDYENYFQGMWDCAGDHPDELSFKRGDAIYILSKEYESFGWWVGEMKGTVGIVPTSYLMEMYCL